MKTLFISFFILLSTLSFGQSSDKWKLVGTNINNDNFYVTDVKLESPGVYKFWLKFGEDLQKGFTNIPYALQQMKVFCQSGSYQVLYYEYHDSDGKITTKMRLVDEYYSDLTPDSMSANIVTYVCKKPSK